MKEREQKTAAQVADCLQGDRLEAEGLAGVQTFMEITENELVEVQIDEKHLMELIVSPYNMNRAYRKVMSNGGSGGVDSMEAKELLPYLKLHKDELRLSLEREVQAATRAARGNPERQRKDAQAGNTHLGRPRNPAEHSAGAVSDV